MKKEPTWQSDLAKIDRYPSYSIPLYQEIVKNVFYDKKLSVDAKPFYFSSRFSQEFICIFTFFEPLSDSKVVDYMMKMLGIFFDYLGSG